MAYTSSSWWPTLKGYVVLTFERLTGAFSLTAGTGAFTLTGEPANLTFQQFGGGAVRGSRFVPTEQPRVTWVRHYACAPATIVCASALTHPRAVRTYLISAEPATVTATWASADVRRTYALAGRRSAVRHRRAYATLTVGRQLAGAPLAVQLAGHRAVCLRVFPAQGATFRGVPAVVGVPLDVQAQRRRARDDEFLFWVAA